MDPDAPDADRELDGALSALAARMARIAHIASRRAAADPRLGALDLALLRSAVRYNGGRDLRREPLDTAKLRDEVVRRLGSAFDCLSVGEIGPALVELRVARFVLRFGAEGRPLPPGVDCDAARFVHHLRALDFGRELRDRLAGVERRLARTTPEALFAKEEDGRSALAAEVAGLRARLDFAVGMIYRSIPGTKRNRARDLAMSGATGAVAGCEGLVPDLPGSTRAQHKLRHKLPPTERLVERVEKAADAL